MGKGKYFRGVVPVSVLGEIAIVIFRNIKDSGERAAKFDLLEKFIKMRDIEFIVPEKEDYRLINELMGRERQSESMDAQHVVCAKRAYANVFVELDKNMLNNRNIESILDLKVLHPSEFVSI